jgi:flagellar biosynthesis/type III secretory pathway protein FliH
MAELIDDYSYGLGYDAGHCDGYDKGYTQGSEDTMRDYNTRLAKMYVELQTLNARIAVVDRKMTDDKPYDEGGYDDGL